MVAPKDKTRKEDKVSAIYHIKCKNCTSSYVGETERPLKKRLAEHRRPSCTSSPVVVHARDTSHELAVKEAKILDSEPKWWDRGIKEAVYIRACKSNLNRDGGRYQLPGAWNGVIESSVARQVALGSPQS